MNDLDKQNVMAATLRKKPFKKMSNLMDRVTSGDPTAIENMKRMGDYDDLKRKSAKKDPRVYNPNSSLDD